MRRIGLLALLVAAVLVALRVEVHLGLPDTASAERPVTVASGGGGHRALAAAWRYDALRAEMPPEEVIALSRAGGYGTLRLALAGALADQGVNLGPRADDLLAVALDPLSQVELQRNCPGLRAEFALLCDPAEWADLTRAVDAWLGKAFSRDFALAAEFRQDEEDLGLLAAEVGCDLGARGSDLAMAVLASPDSGRGAALATSLLACTLPREEAVDALEVLLERDGAVALAAALELGRLQSAGSVPRLSSLQQELGASAHGKVVSYAQVLAEGDSP